ncbi:signal peptidase I [Isoptericola sp. b441]|uniref:Signal peptidase I n=1 Tax=Actinotalea lenta TaxID=3064654 RepID=A0ABT9D9Z9_9CELL|nr:MULTISPECIES: signal peptidase I [unclassified Isoptericola]MDO8107331.1 signal peptidase I [Isoptericola sp. b441]MDO8121006.1 signal peptidase I [Isoptericola sp. b490]
MVRETAIILVSAIVLSLVVKTYLAQAFYIPSGSMEQTLEIGDRVMVTKLAPGPLQVHRGDIVVFKDPGGWLPPPPPPSGSAPVRTVRTLLTYIGLLPQDSGEHLIKRVIGVGGDHVTCCDDRGRLTVNGTAIDEPYLAAGDVPSEIQFDVTVPQGYLWVMGDNRQNSEDSRYHQGNPGGGAVPMSDVVGVAFVTLWPLDRVRLLRNPGPTFADVPSPTGP